MRFLLDTNIVSQAVLPRPSPAFRSWIIEQRDDDLFIASMTVGEIWRGVLQLPTGRRRAELETWFEGSDGPLQVFGDRVLPFDDKAALIWARLMAEAKIEGRPRDGLDTVIAAVAEANGCVVATDNERDFRGVEIFNPLRPPP